MVGDPEWVGVRGSASGDGGAWNSGVVLVGGGVSCLKEAISNSNAAIFCSLVNVGAGLLEGGLPTTGLAGWRGGGSSIGVEGPFALRALLFVGGGWHTDWIWLGD